eukprot:TRINITY_DN5933_c0_g1_i1.p1 TRINITY_DN5933_c0_g1~~TRINITY_DN5933_c0_g1_i1.p1  ORF type:complete len:420 (+),score=79.70 TRINITY_DN5933_c0_g1_i1:954-2213(+)
MLHVLNRLDLRGNNIVDIPPCFSTLKSLNYLRLCHNRIRALPNFFTSLSFLTHLDVSYNQISVIPEYLESLQSLQSLILDKNTLDTLPYFFANMPNLVNLSFDVEILDSRALKFWQSITKASRNMDLSDCGLGLVPSCIFRLSQIRQLNLENNRIVEIPYSFLQLNQLKWINLSRNFLNQIPSFLWCLPNLQWIDLSENMLVTVFVDTGNHSNNDAATGDQCSNGSSRPLSPCGRPKRARTTLTPVSTVTTCDTLPSRLVYVDLSRNLISAIGLDVVMLQSLRMLHLGDNPLDALPIQLSQLIQLEMISLGASPLSVAHHIHPHASVSSSIASQLHSHGFSAHSPSTMDGFQHASSQAHRQQRRSRHRSRHDVSAESRYLERRKEQAKVALIHSVAQAVPHLRELSLSHMGLLRLPDEF